MNVSLYQAAAGLSANAQWQDIIAQNLAASGIPGFKKQEMSFSAIAAGMLPAGVEKGMPTKFSVPEAQVVTNFEQGSFRPTGLTTDLAIVGPGFFSVQLPNGDTAYTRDGEFQINPQGQLVTKQGYTVLGDGGPIQIDRNNPAPLSISADGDVSQGTDVKGTIRLTTFGNPQLLQPLGNSLYLAKDLETKPSDAVGTTVRQGALEAANTSAVSEMAHLIVAMRQFETNQRVIQMQDERMSRVIGDLGGPS